MMGLDTSLFTLGSPSKSLRSEAIHQGNHNRRYYMHPLIQQLRSDHADLGSLLLLLRRQSLLMAEPLTPDVGLLVDALYYLTRFPDVTHHTMEDRIASRLRDRNALTNALLQELEEQHQRIRDLGMNLLRDLEGALRDEWMSRELVATSIQLYVERLRHNMAFEELMLFPAAERVLDDSDWQQIAPETRIRVSDPLFHDSVAMRFAQLRAAIEREIKCASLAG